MQEDERIIFYQYVCSTDWSNEHDYPILNKIWSYGFQCVWNWQFEIDIYGVFEFSYQQTLAQLDKHKTSLCYRDKGSTGNWNNDKLIYILDFKTCLPMPWNNSKTAQTYTYIYIYIYMEVHTSLVPS